MKLKELLQKGLFFLDGGMGTLLQARGLKPGEAPERVHVEVEGSQVNISVKLIIKMNENIIKISKKVQDKVKQSVENMTCLEVVNVDVNIASVGE